MQQPICCGYYVFTLVPSLDIDDTPSRPFTGFDWSEHVQVTNLIASLLNEYIDWYRDNKPNARIRDEDKIQQHLIHVVLEAYRNYLALPELCMGIHLSKAYYSDNQLKRYHPDHLSYRILINVLAFLVHQGYLEMPYGKGTWAPNPNDRRTTRYRATEVLMLRCQKFRLSRFMITDYPYKPPEIIILKDKKVKGLSSGKPVDYEDTDFSLQARRRLKIINDFLSRHCLNLDITDEKHQLLRKQLRRHNDAGNESPCIDFTQVRLKRIFNNASFEQGGRFYGAWWQQIPSDYRIFITIDSKRTAQLDYSGMHFSIMYAQAGMDLPMEDPYALPGYDKSLRGDIKVAFNAIVNCNSERQAIQTVDYYIRKGGLSRELISGQKIIEQFIQLHAPIKDKLASGEGIKGHFIDSQIAERILLKGIDADLCILPIHDGFITTTRDIPILKHWMLEVFEEVTGHQVKVKPETFNLSIIDCLGQITPYWIAYSDNHYERNGHKQGKATAYSVMLNKQALQKQLHEDTFNKTIRDTVNNEWKSVNKKVST